MSISDAGAIATAPAVTLPAQWPRLDAVIGAALLIAALLVGLATAADYGMTVDEFNTDDYGPKALAWYASLSAPRHHLRPNIWCKPRAAICTRAV